MEIEWLWQNLASDWLAWLLALMGSAVVAYLKRRYPHLATQIMYGLGAGALILVSLYAFRGWTTLPNQQPKITIENVEPNIKTWIDTFCLTVQKETDQTSFFTYKVTLRNRVEVIVKRDKSYDRYVMLRSGFSLPLEVQHIIRNLPKEQQERMINELVLEMARLNIQWDLSGSPLNRINLLKLVPISNSFTEDIFANNVHAMANANILAQTKLFLLIPYP